MNDEIMMSFNVDDFKAKLKRYGLSLANAGLLIERSTGYWYRPMRTGKVNRSDFYTFHNKLKALSPQTESSENVSGNDCAKELESVAESLIENDTNSKDDTQLIKSFAGISDFENLELKNLHDSIKTLYNLVKYRGVSVERAVLKCENIEILLEMHKENHHEKK